MKNQKNLTEEIMVKRMSLVSIIGNIILSIFKFVAGIFANSSAMISDAIHSLSDVLSTFIAVIGVKLSKRKENHILRRRAKRRVFDGGNNPEENRRQLRVRKKRLFCKGGHQPYIKDSRLYPQGKD